MIFNTVKLWTISLAKRRTAPYWLGFIAFIESFIFFIPADVLYIPIALVRPQKAYFYAFIATFFSVLGGILGWCLGYFASDVIVKPLLEFTNQYENFQILYNDTTQEFLAVLLTVSGLAHLPLLRLPPFLQVLSILTFGFLFFSVSFPVGHVFIFLLGLFNVLALKQLTGFPITLNG
ncbi:membrane protein YqaA, SNARE-associated domain [Bartonella sp. AR 15-3]|nr:membrane protein YqaA, SNARE-associated domain [Bartonella sp. AR 15-3]